MLKINSSKKLNNSSDLENLNFNDIKELFDENCPNADDFTDHYDYMKSYNDYMNGPIGQIYSKLIEKIANEDIKLFEVQQYEKDIEKLKEQARINTYHTIQKLKSLYKSHDEQLAHSFIWGIGKACTETIESESFEGKPFFEILQEAAKLGSTHCGGGRNSLYRELVVVDMDGDNKDGSTVPSNEEIIKKANEIGIKLDYIRIRKENNHKQIGLFINTKIKEVATGRNGLTYNKNIQEKVEEYSFLYKFLNTRVFNGDPGYVGYICQNPFNNHGYETIWLQDNKPVDFKDKIINPQNVLALDKQLLKAYRAELPLSPENTSGIHNRISFLLESMRTSHISHKERNHSGEGQRRWTGYIPYDESFFKIYWITCTQVAKKFKIKNEFDKEHLPVIAQWVKSAMKYYGDTGYSEDEENFRIMSNLKELLEDSESEEPKVNWDKVYYTDLDRRISQHVRKVNKMMMFTEVINAVCSVPEANWESSYVKEITLKLIKPSLPKKATQRLKFDHLYHIVLTLRHFAKDNGIETFRNGKFLTNFFINNVNIYDIHPWKFWSHTGFKENHKGFIEIQLKDLKRRMQSEKLKSIKSWYKKPENSILKDILAKIDDDSFDTIDSNVNHNNTIDRNIPFTALNALNSNISLAKNTIHIVNSISTNHTSSLIITNKIAMDAKVTPDSNFMVGNTMKSNIHDEKWFVLKMKYYIGKIFEDIWDVNDRKLMNEMSGIQFEFRNRLNAA